MTLAPRPFDASLPVRDALASSVAVDGRSPILFLSDLHFGDGSRTDLFAGQERPFFELVERHRHEVGAIVFLGDIFDMPQAWSVSRIVAAHPALIAYVGELARRHRVFFVRGNHDWSVDYEAVFPGARRVQALRIGERILAWHGHQVDLYMNPAAPRATAKTYVHALLERAVGKRLIPPLEHHDSRANRIAIGSAVAWSRLSLSRARALRGIGRARAADSLEESVHYLARSVLGDPADVFGATLRTVLGGELDTVICGHTHMPGLVRTERGTYVNTGTWASGVRTYALWTGAAFRVLEVDGGRELGDECYARVPLRTDPRELFSWWSQARHAPRATR